MSFVKRVGDLEVDEDLGFQDAEWTMERFGWVAIVIVVGLAGLGLFGHGPISWTSASTADGALEVRYERFGRRGGPMELVIEAAATAAERSVWRVELPQDYLDGFQIQSVVPEPDAVDTLGGTIRYTFSQGEPGARLEAVFSLRPEALWRHRGEISLADRAVTVSHFFFP